MSKASIPVFTEAGSNTVRISYRFVARKADGGALAGAEGTVTLEGDGSLAPRHDAKRVLRMTNAEGAGEVIWYRRGIYGRDVHATLTVEAPEADASITVEQNVPTTA